MESETKIDRRTIEQLHALYASLTGMAIRLEMERERLWWEWLKNGFTQDDLRRVVTHLQRGIRDQRRNTGALKFRNLIGQIDKFEEDLAEAKAMGRERDRQMEPARASVLRATGRPDEPPAPESRPAGEVIAGLKPGSQWTPDTKAKWTAWKKQTFGK